MLNDLKAALDHLEQASDYLNRVLSREDCNVLLELTVTMINERLAESVERVGRVIGFVKSQEETRNQP
jgi:hypothetical protein